MSTSSVSSTPKEDAEGSKLTSKVQAVGLRDVVGLTSDCYGECRRRTQRFIDEVGLKPWGMGWMIDYVADGRREEVHSQCLEKCVDVQRICPPLDEIPAATEDIGKNVAQTADGEVAMPGGLSMFRWRRCEEAAHKFTNALFVASERPTHVFFDTRPKDMKKEFLQMEAQSSQMPRPTRYGAPAQPQSYVPDQDGRLPPMDHLKPEVREAFERLMAPGAKDGFMERYADAKEVAKKKIEEGDVPPPKAPGAGMWPDEAKSNITPPPGTPSLSPFGMAYPAKPTGR